MRVLSIAVAGLLALALLVFSLQNLASVEVAFLTWTLSMPKAAVVIGCYLLGVATGALLFAVATALGRGGA